MKRRISVAILVIASLLVVSSGVLAMPSAKIVEGENSVGFSVAKFREAMSFCVAGQMSAGDKLAFGAGAGKLPKIGAKDGVSLFGAYVGYNLYESSEDKPYPYVSLYGGIASASGEDVKVTFPVVAIGVSQDLSDNLSYNLAYAPGFGKAAKKWAFSGEILYKLNKEDSYSFNVGYTLLGGLSQGNSGSVHAGISFGF